MRRYTCTYYAPNFLYPPIELMYLKAIIREWKKDGCILIDAIAEGLNLNKVISRLKEYQPDLLVFMAGIESFTEDMQTIMAIKSYFPSLKIACIGYLPSVFPKETLQNNPAIDYIIMGEPELTFSEIYDVIKERKYGQNIAGIAQRVDGNIIVAGCRQRIRDLDRIPFPDRSLINIGLYNEFLLKKPFTTILTTRGCPFECTFCIRTYGREVIHRSVESVSAEIEEAIFKYQVKTIHFLDDTFTLKKDKILELCNHILKKNLKLQWTALSRIGMLHKDILSLMKKSGLRRIYLGIETGSQGLLDYYKKGYKADLIKEQVKIIKENDIEVGGSFMVGGLQTEKEFNDDIALVKQIDLDYIIVEKLTPYPGTKLFEDLKDNIIFSLFPYSNRFKDNRLEEKAIRLEKSFYHKFYFSYRRVIKMFKYLFLNPRDTINGIRRLVQYLFFYKDDKKTRSELI